MELSTTYNPKDIESHWYKQWMEHNVFSSTPDDRPAYTVVIPPPNVTGVLHMGHMLNNTIQDVLIRRARMQGFNACWVPGMDHASIATEAKVVAKLAEEGISKSDLTREEFLAHAFEWKEKYGGIILEQLKKLGCSCDWNRTRFTMEPELYSSVIKVFVDLHDKDLIYKGIRMVNWDPAGKTALSDEEVIHKEVDSLLYYVKYAIKDSDEFITIATTRPETILGDTAVCVNPKDERYTHLKGKMAVLPMVGREIPIIFDDYVDPEFGTGALKITPAHDINDYEIGQRHGLETIDTLNDDGTMSEAAGFYIGEDRFIVRKKIAKDLDDLGVLVKKENIKNKVGTSERTGAVIEPKISSQWFVNMEKFLEANPEVVSSVMEDQLKFFPSKFKNTYRHWMENIKDWCISRQLWWGQQIPAYYLPNGQYVVAETKEEALIKAKSIQADIKLEDLKQDEDVLDTWFSSWLWPISVFNGINEPENEELAYYYPTKLIVTGPDIIFFWIARMIMAGYEYQDEQPFEHVYFTGIVRDKKGRKMSKQLGNSPDAIALMDQYGTDGVRMGLLMAAPAGNDLLFDESLCEQGRNFSNKIWNAYRLTETWEKAEDQYGFYATDAQVVHDWMQNRLNETVESVEHNLKQYRVSDAMTTLYKVIWGDFCSWYLEWMKPEYGKPIPKQDYDQIRSFFEQFMLLLHPFMPFVTEHLWQAITNKQGEFINLQDAPKAKEMRDDKLVTTAMELITTVRSLRNTKGISPKMGAQVNIKTDEIEHFTKAENLVNKLANLASYGCNSDEQGITQLMGTTEVILNFEGADVTAVDKDELEKELKRLKGFLFGVDKKLSNEKFMANAKPEIIEREQQKKADAESKIQSIEAQLGAS
jgi:valyl-tRNA synthetase